MAIQFQSIKCPDCGANLQIGEQGAPSYCSYCGASIIMTNDREIVHRYIDEAELRRAETERAVQMKRIDIMERKQAERERNIEKAEREEAELQSKREQIAYAKRKKTLAAIVIGAVILLSIRFDISFVGTPLLLSELVIFFLIHRDKKRLEEVGVGEKLRVPSVVSEFSEKSYTMIEAALSGAGFKNIRCVPLNDLVIGIRKKPGTVESIVINGHAITSSGGKYPAESTVVISYHSFPEK